MRIHIRHSSLHKDLMAITGRRTELERLTERLAVNFKLLAACKVYLRLNGEDNQFNICFGSKGFLSRRPGGCHEKLQVAPVDMNEFVTTH